MSPSQSKKLAVLTIATIFGVGLAKSLIVDEEFPPFRFFAATGFAGFGLSVAADIEPRVAGPFSVLILTVVLMEEGIPLATKLADLDRQSAALSKYRNLSNQRSIRKARR